MLPLSVTTFKRSSRKVIPALRQPHGNNIYVLLDIMTQTELARYNKQLRGWLSYAFARYQHIIYMAPVLNH